MLLSESTFKMVLECTPLVSIDLVVENQSKEYLVGKRLNRPAKGFWFVPGGRILKGETLSNAYSRLTKAELGIECDIKDATLLGVYDHLYNDCVFGDAPTTHYVAIAYRLKLSDVGFLPLEQHSSFRWQHSSEILQSSDVHSNTKAYFKKSDF